MIDTRAVVHRLEAWRRNYDLPVELADELAVLCERLRLASNAEAVIAALEVGEAVIAALEAGIVAAVERRTRKLIAAAEQRLNERIERVRLTAPTECRTRH
jgi:hypothetical protein